MDSATLPPLLWDMNDFCHSHYLLWSVNETLLVNKVYWALTILGVGPPQKKTWHELHETVEEVSEGRLEQWADRWRTLKDVDKLTYMILIGQLQLAVLVGYCYWNTQEPVLLYFMLTSTHGSKNGGNLKRTDTKLICDNLDPDWTSEVTRSGSDRHPSSSLKEQLTDPIRPISCGSWKLEATHPSSGSD